MFEVVAILNVFFAAVSLRGSVRDTVLSTWAWVVDDGGKLQPRGLEIKFRESPCSNATPH